MWRWPWAWRTSTRSVTSAIHTSAPAFMGQASPSGVGEHLSEGDTRLRPADPSKKLLTLSKTREGMRRLQMGYVWELRNLVESGRSVFVCWYFEEEEKAHLFQIWEERLHCGYSACVHRCKIKSWKHLFFKILLFSLNSSCDLTREGQDRFISFRNPTLWIFLSRGTFRRLCLFSGQI